MKIYLASESPRRNMLLKKIGVEFEQITPQVEEISRMISGPEDLAKRNAVSKAKSVLKEIRDGLIITADTIVVKDSEILGKPRNNQEAYRMLEMLSGTTHEVFTAVVVLQKKTDKMEVEVERTTVTMRKLNEKEIKEYISSGEPLDAAGGYKIQEMGGKLVRRIEGCYYNVVGLPIATLIEMLKKFNIEV